MHPLDQDAKRAERDAHERRVQREADRTFAADVRDVFGSPQGRRLLRAFLATSTIDSSPLRFDAQGRGDALLTSHATGWHDAARWWLAAVREHCPEREAQMHKEANEAAKRAAQPGDESDDGHHDD